MPSLADLTWPRRTERCLVRRAAADDAGALWRYWQVPQVPYWTGGRDGQRDGLVASLADPARRAVRLVVEHDGLVVGDLDVEVADGWSQHGVREQAAGTEAEIGWAFDPAYGGRGLATEAARLLVQICFSPAPDGLGLRRVTAECFADNTASWRLMERVGMRREAHHVRDSLHAELGWIDGYTYALLADEWSG